MEKIITKAQLIERLKDIRAVEIQARDKYDQDVHTFKNFKITETMKNIKSDEDRHINILSGLISLLEN